MFYYSGKDLKAVRMEDHKLHIIPGSRGGLPNYELYNIARDPAEKFGAMYHHLWSIVPFQRMVGSHMGLIRNYPTGDTNQAVLNVWGQSKNSNGQARR